MSNIYYIVTTNSGYLYTAAIIFGLLIGSFLNVVIYRLPIMLHRRFRTECLNYLQEHPSSLLPAAIDASADSTSHLHYNLVVPRSRCPHCGHMISAMENIPVFSYLFLGGRCSNCKSRISLRYPLIEAVTALLACVVAWKFGPNLTMVFALFFTFSLIALTVIDFDTQYLPDEITLPFIWLGILINIQGLFASLESSVWGAIVGYLVLWAVYHVFKFITHKEGMGYGDFKLLAMLGAWLGWQAIPAIIIISSLIGSLVGIGLIFIRRHDRNIPIPFGPYLTGAGFIMLLFKEEIHHFYFFAILKMPMH